MSNLENQVNTYKKFCPNVFVAKCPEKHESGETIVLTTKYGKEHECTVFNCVGKTTDGFFLYSITRNDGTNAQTRAQAKAERLNGYASNAEKRSQEHWKQSDMSEEATGIPFGQPILVGHHSERRHRKTLERAHRHMDKSVEESNKAEEYKRRAEYWEGKANTINLSMPGSLDYFEFKLEEAKKKHQFLKDNPSKRAHSFSLTYAKKDVNELQKKVETAVKLWGDPELLEQLANEKQAKAIAKAEKDQKAKDLIQNVGGFFAFNNFQFKEKYNKLLESGEIEEGDKVKSLGAGLYVPSKNVPQYIEGLKQF